MDPAQTLQESNKSPCENLAKTIKNLLNTWEFERFGCPGYALGRVGNILLGILGASWAHLGASCWGLGRSSEAWQRDGGILARLG